MFGANYFGQTFYGQSRPPYTTVTPPLDPPSIPSEVPQNDISEIQSEIIRRLGFGARTNPQDLLVAIDEAQKRIYNKLIKIKEDLFYGQVTFNAQTGKHEYTVDDGAPPDIKRILRVETRYSDQDCRTRATKIELQNINRFDEISTIYKNKHQPRHYLFGSGNNTTIGFIPAHDVNGQDYNKVWYLKRLPKITDASQSLIIPQDAFYLIIEFGLAVAQTIEDEDKTAYLQFLKRWDQDVDDWVESEYPSVSEPMFTQDVEEDC